MDADDLVAGMIDVARSVSMELGKLEVTVKLKRAYLPYCGLGCAEIFHSESRSEDDDLQSRRVDRLQQLFRTVYQYTYARIQSILRKAKETAIAIPIKAETTSLNDKERSLLKIISLFPEVVKEAGKAHSPAVVANYVYRW